jgi:hypothetical protein
MEQKMLGKITHAEFGCREDYPCMLGLLLTFCVNGSCYVDDGGKYMVDASKNYKWENTDEELKAFRVVFYYTYSILKAAKCSTVSELVGKPVEITLRNDIFEDFRILTEVL